jgi:hypothetical protein
MKLILIALLFSTQVYADNLVDPKTGKYLGKLNANRYDADSVSNPYGRYGSRYSTDSVNNPRGRYGSRYSTDSINNPYTTGGPVIYGGDE